jgi:hypothetical protein
MSRLGGICRRGAIILLTLLLPAAALAQTLPGGTPPPVHPGTRLNFPPTIAGAQMERSYTTQIGRDVLVVYQYLFDRMQISVGLYDGGRRVSTGSDNPMVIAEFASEVLSAESTLKSEGMTNFEKPAVPSSCAYGSLIFRCIIYSALAQRDRQFSKLMLTGYNGYFLKIRADWSQSSGRTSIEAERALQSFIPALMR